MPSLKRADNPIVSDLPPHLAERAWPVNTGEINAGGEFVLCWLHHAVRDHDNPALDTAVTIGNKHGKPVLVYMGLGGNHRFNADRHHAFILQGARDLAARLNARSIACAFHLPADPASASPIHGLASRACAVITEDFPASPMPRWTATLAARSPVAVLALDCDCLAPMRQIKKQHTRAFKFRDAAKKQWRARIREPWRDVEPAVGPLDLSAADLGFKPIDLEAMGDPTGDPVGLDEAIAGCDIDHAIPALRHIPGGSAAGYARWEAFKRSGLCGYASKRNDAINLDGVSRLSPYLHYGHVSPFRIAREADEIGGKGPEKYLDELLVWRELAHNFCAHASPDELDTLASVPDWAVDTLREHAGDERPAVHSWETLARAKTGDPLWDACQDSLLIGGELHNNVRMTWGKAILNWTKSPEDTLRLLLDLNHRFALDGSDPNSYGGLLWAMGQFDRAFEPGQPVIGTIRPRDTESHAERCDPTAFRDAVNARVGLPPFRVAVIGAGVAGLACARTLYDQGCDVTIMDKGRGFGGRLSTRRRDLDDAPGDPLRFDHGTPAFAVTDPRFGRHVRSWIELGVAARWNPRAVQVTDGNATECTPGETMIVGMPGLNAVCAHLGSDLSVAFNTRVTSIEREAGGWSIAIDGVQPRKGFDAVVVALPPNQAVDLIPASHPGFRESIGSIEMKPIWTMLLAVRGTQTPDLALFEGHAVFEKLITNTSKPGRERADGISCVVAHANEPWSREHLELDKPDAAATMRAALITELEQTFGTTLAAQDIVHEAGHRWRYARVTQPIPQRCLHDDDAALTVCGDGLGGDDVEAAFLSGTAAAGRVLALRSRRVLQPGLSEPGPGELFA
ncbi:MAG: FAD-dependent oxidoreductase [Planctomycetota bacterium]